MNTWKVNILSASVSAELDVMPQDIRGRFSRIVSLIEEFGLDEVGMPHVRPLGNKLWEMRMKGRDGIGRAIYVVATGKQIFVVHAFIKKTQATPPAAIKLATQRAREAGLI